MLFRCSHLEKGHRRVERVSEKSNEENKSYKTASSQLLEFWGDNSWGVWQQSFESWGSWSIQTVLSFTNLSVKDIGVWGKNSKRQFENKWRVTFSHMRLVWLWAEITWSIGETRQVHGINIHWALTNLQKSYVGDETPELKMAGG